MVYSAADELRDRIAVVSVAAEHFVGVGEIEHLLDDLLGFVQSDRVARDMAAAILSELAQVWPWGALEILEFTMHTLRWDEVRAALQHHAESGSDFRTRDMARSALQAFEDEWPGGEIYRRYRSE